MDELEKLRKEIERLKEWNNNVRNSTRHMTLQEEDFNRGKHSSYLEILNFIDSMQEEPVSEDLEAYIKERVSKVPIVMRSGFHQLCKQLIRDGANWQAEQFEKNRLKHCNSITNEQAELEQGFIDQHLDKHQRMPTFLDAIEYGMEKMKQQIMAKAIRGRVRVNVESNYHSLIYGCWDMNDALKNCNDGSKVKVIVIKDD